jgi:hypothetical protein
MANRRQTKKDINHLCFEVIGECITFLEHTSSLNQENVYQIMSDAVELRNNLISLINKPNSVNSSDHTSRLFYRELKKDLYGGTISMIERLNSLPR